jgi:hypothetical protein
MNIEINLISPVVINKIEFDKFIKISDGYLEEDDEDHSALFVKDRAYVRLTLIQKSEGAFMFYEDHEMEELRKLLKAEPVSLVITEINMEPEAFCLAREIVNKFCQNWKDCIIDLFEDGILRCSEIDYLDKLL